MRHLILAAALAITATPVFAQDVGESIDVAGWTIRRTQASDKTQTCVAATLADDKTGVGFGGTTDMQGFLLLIDAGAKFMPGDKYALEYKVDSGKNVKTQAVATTPATLVLPLGTLNDVAPFFTAVETGDNIHLETDKTAYDYPLNGSKKALAALSACLMAAMAK